MCNIKKEWFWLKKCGIYTMRGLKVLQIFAAGMWRCVPEEGVSDFSNSHITYIFKVKYASNSSLSDWKWRWRHYHTSKSGNLLTYRRVDTILPPAALSVWETTFWKIPWRVYVSEYCIVSSLFECEPESNSLTITSSILDCVVTLALVYATFHRAGNC